ncbi:hypothetical protein EIP86_002742 [Pleurotus ostreatoroseus]|nr:hypothetical protein EIP86_002742 [Pleurotus ostreatoroseus]
MPSYFRRLFGDSSNHDHTPRPSSSKADRSRHTHFAEVPPQGAQYARSEARYGHSARSNPPSPFGPPIDVNVRTAHRHGKTPAPVPSTSELRPQVLRRASHNKTPGSVPVPLPMHTYTAGHSTPASSRSNSSNSLFATMNSVPYYHDSIHHATPSRPPLSANDSWQSASSLGSSYYQPQPVAYAQPRRTALHMHPLLAYTKLHHAPITYDVTFTPSARTVLDHATHSPIPPHTLAEPATDPPTPAASRLILRSHKFPWTVVVAGAGAGAGGASPRFTVGPPKHRSRALVITNLDLLYAVHTTLLTPVTPEEWESLGHGSRAQQKVTKAYERRCTRMGGGWEGGVRRIDWLGEKTRFVGVEVDRSTGVGKLVFAKA